MAWNSSNEDPVPGTFQMVSFKRQHPVQELISGDGTKAIKYLSENEEHSQFSPGILSHLWVFVGESEG